LSFKDLKPPKEDRHFFQRTLYYQPGLEYLYFMGIFIAAIPFLPLLFVSFSVQYMVVIEIFVVAAVIFLRLPRTFDRVHLEKDHMVIEDKKQKRMVRFNEIESVRITNLPYLFRHLKVKLKSGEVFAFSTLARSDHILYNILQFNPKLVDEEDFMRYRQSSVGIDQTVSRFHEDYIEKKYLVKYYLLMPLAASVLFVLIKMLMHPAWVATAPLLSQLTWINCIFVYNFFLGFTLFGIFDLICLMQTRARMQADVNVFSRDRGYERKIQGRVRWIHTSVLFFMAILFAVMSSLI